VGIAALTPSTTPQQSARGFVAPTSVPVKKTPSIADIVGEKGETEKGEREKAEREKAESNDEPTVGATLAVASLEQVNEKTEVGEKSPSNFEGVDGEAGRGSLYENETIIDDESKPQPTPDNVTIVTRNDCNDLEPHWRTMFQQVFASVPTIYYPLKETLPQIENNIIKVTVKNDIQKEHFEAKKREVLEYLRTHYDEKIEDVEVTTNEKMETKKIIYDVKDKLQNFKEQNEEFEDFLQILDLKIKD
jgi:hypothetical protein